MQVSKKEEGTKTRLQDEDGLIACAGHPSPRQRATQIHYRNHEEARSRLAEIPAFAKELGVWMSTSGYRL